MTIENELKRIADALEKLVLLGAANTALSTMEPEEEKEEVRAGVAAQVEDKPFVEPTGSPEMQAIVDNAGGVPLPAEPPKKKRGRPSKAELEAKAAVAARTDVPPATLAEAVAADICDGASKVIATALPLEVGNEGIPPTAHVIEEKPKCPDCGTVLTPENSSVSSVSKKRLHVGCKAEPDAATERAIEKAREPVLTIEKVRSEAIAFVQSKGDAGREALVAVLEKFSAKSISELPEPKWPEFVAQMKAA